MEQRLIDANALIEKAEYLPLGYKSNGMRVCFHGVTAAMIENAPTINPESLRPTAHWIYGGGVGSYVWSCSKCNSSQYVCSRYCPDCGAKMEVKSDEI